MRSDFALTPAQRADARAALTLLAGSNLTLEEVARRALQGRRATTQVRVDAAADQFLRTRLDLRARTSEWYEQQLNRLVGAFGERNVGDVTRPDFHAWVNSLTMSAASRAALVRACRTFWTWAIAREPQIAVEDPTAGLASSSEHKNPGDAHFLTPEEVGKVMRAAGPYRSALALMFFAGLRPDEVAGRYKPPLLWRSVHIEEKTIRVPADAAKTGKPRIIEGMPATVWRWLEPGAGDARVSPGATRQATARAKGAIQRAEWPQDATRHTFATYALAYTQDAGKVAHWLGHEGNPTMLHRHYRGLATKAEAEKFWALAP